MSHRSKTCQNCDTLLPPGADYCSGCGQRYREGVPGFWHFVAEGLGDVFNLDSRLWLTLRDLFVPGRMSRAWFRGQRRRYLPPVRIAIIAALLLVTASLYRIGKEDFMGFAENRAKELQRITYYQDLQHLDTLTRNMAATATDTTFLADIDTLRLKMGIESDSVDYRVTANFVTFNEEDFNFTSGGKFGLQVELQDVYSDLPVDSLMRKYGVEGFVDELLFRQNIRLRKRGDNFGVYLLTTGAWAFLLTIPVGALLFMLLYIRRDYKYLHHTVFLLHTVTALLVAFIFMVLFGHHSPGWIIGGGFVLLAVFLFASLYRTYRQSFFKTLLKFTIVGLFYVGLIVPLVAVCVLIIRVALY